MMHHTKEKGDLAVIKVMLDLVQKGFSVFLPAVSEHLQIDLIAYHNQTHKLLRIQCKYSTNGKARNKSSWADKHGNHVKTYKKDDFDYYAIYLPNVDKVIYPNIKFGNKTIRTSFPNSPTKFYWYEDFLDFTDTASKKNYKDFGYIMPFSFHKNRTTVRPTKEILQMMIWEKPSSHIAKEFSVSDKAVSKWCKVYGLTKPPRGYWSKINKKVA